MNDEFHNDEDQGRTADVSDHPLTLWVTLALIGLITATVLWLRR